MGLKLTNDTVELFTDLSEQVKHGLFELPLSNGVKEWSMRNMYIAFNRGDLIDALRVGGADFYEYEGSIDVDYFGNSYEIDLSDFDGEQHD